MSRRKQSTPVPEHVTLKGPLSQQHNQAFLTTLRAMPEFAQLFQFVHLFKRALGVAEPVEIEVLEEELLSNTDSGRLTKQITWALVKANLRIKRKNVDDVELWNMARKVWEGHRGEWEEATEELEARDHAESAVDDGAADKEAESAKVESADDAADAALTKLAESESHDAESAPKSRATRSRAKRAASPPPSPPAKRTRSTRSRAKAEAESEKAESAKSRKSRVKKEPTPEIDHEAIAREEAESAAAEAESAAASRDLDLRNHQHKLVLPDLDFNPFADSPTLPSSFSRFTAFQLVKIWYQMTQWIFDHEDKSRDLVELTLKMTDYKAEELRSEPLGWDNENHVYYLFGDSRLYRRAEKLTSAGFDVLDTDIDTWTCVCATWEEWEAFVSNLESRDAEYKKLTKGKGRKKVDEALKYDSELYGFFSRDVVPVVKEVFLEKSRASASRDKERSLEAAMATRKTSSRIQAMQAKKDEQDKIERKEAESREAMRAERKRAERIELQRRQMEERQLARERRFERRNGDLRNRDDSADLSALGNNDESAENDESSSRRRRPPPRAAAAATTTWTFDCICGIHGLNYEDESAMIECETCKTWMHLECLRDRRNVDTESFECDVCGSREEREARARERARVEAEKAEKRKKAEEERVRAEEEKTRLKKEKNAARWQERKRRMKEKKEQEEKERDEARDEARDEGTESRDITNTSVGDSTLGDSSFMTAGDVSRDIGNQSFTNQPSRDFLPPPPHQHHVTHQSHFQQPFHPGQQGPFQPPFQGQLSQHPGQQFGHVQQFGGHVPPGHHQQQHFGQQQPFQQNVSQPITQHHVQHDVSQQNVTQQNVSQHVTQQTQQTQQTEQITQPAAEHVISSIPAASVTTVSGQTVEFKETKENGHVNGNGA